MKIEIKRFCIWDDHSQQFYPEEPEYFFAMVDMDIGPANAEGGDMFNLMVGLSQQFARTSSEGTICLFIHMTKTKSKKKCDGSLIASKGTTGAKLRPASHATSVGNTKTTTKMVGCPHHSENTPSKNNSRVNAAPLT